LKIDHCLVFISIKLSCLTLRVYESGLFSFRKSKRSLHLAKFLFNNNKYFCKFVLVYLPLQNFCVFPIFESYYVSIFIPKSKTDIYRDGNTVVISLDIEDGSLSGLYFNKIIVSYLILRVYERGLFSFPNSTRSLHLVEFLFNNNKYFSKGE
jgi:hypothetical protein